MSQPTQSAFAVSSEQQVPEKVVEAVVDPGQPDSYKIVRSATGKNYVETNDYDPLEHHRSRDPAANKGQGLGFLFCCCGSKTSEETETK